MRPRAIVFEAEPGHRAVSHFRYEFFNSTAEFRHVSAVMKEKRNMTSDTISSNA